MSQKGLGVMIDELMDNAKSVAAYSHGVNKQITGLEINSERLLFTFADGYQMKLFDNGQSCCEYRHMHTDDDLTYFIGTTLMEVEVREGPETTTEYGEPKESEFLIVTTSKGAFTVVNYNEHNGYYGGFLLEARGWYPEVTHE